MASTSNTSGTSPGVTHTTNVPLHEAKRGLEGFRKQLAHRQAMLHDAVAVYRVTRLPSRTVYMHPNVVQPLIEPQPLIFSSRYTDK